MVPNQLSIIYPGLTRIDFQNLFMHTKGKFINILAVGIILAAKAQITAWYSPRPEQEIQQLSTQKTLSKVLAKEPSIRKIFATVAVYRTISFESTALLNIVPTGEQSLNDAVIDHLDNVINDLVTGTPPRGAALKSPAELDTSNIQEHRFAIIASIIGHFLFFVHQFLTLKILLKVQKYIQLLQKSLFKPF
jgi:hypothetical protein